MPSHSSFGSIQLDVTTGESPAKITPHEDTPFRIAVLGDFSGRASRGIVETGRDLAQRSPLLIDRDNFDEVMEKLEVEIHLPVAGSVHFKELEDFHPDQLQSRLPMFSNLRKVASEVSLTTPQTEPEIQHKPAPHPQPIMDLDGLLDQAVEETEGRTEDLPAGTKDNFQSWLDKKVAPHLEPKTEGWSGADSIPGGEGHRFSDAGINALPNFPGNRISLAGIVLSGAPNPDKLRPQALLDRYH